MHEGNFHLLGSSGVSVSFSENSKIGPKTTATLHIQMNSMNTHNHQWNGKHANAYNMYISPIVYIRNKNCALLCIIGMHSSMHNQAFFFFYTSTVTRLVHSISHKHRNPALTYPKMFVVAKRSPLMPPSRVSCISTCSPRYLNSNVATRAICRKRLLYTASWIEHFPDPARWTVVKRQPRRKRGLQTWHASHTHTHTA